MKNHMVIDTECPNCQTWQNCERDEDGDPDLETQPCHADDCRKHLCKNCPQFECEGCHLAHCEDHKRTIEGIDLCPICARGAIEEMVSDFRATYQEMAQQDVAQFVGVLMLAGVTSLEAAAVAKGLVN